MLNWVVFWGIDPLAYSGGQQVYSPYAAMGNAPGEMIDPNGERFSSVLEQKSAGADAVQMQYEGGRNLLSGGPISEKINALLGMFYRVGDVSGILSTGSTWVYDLANDYTKITQFNSGRASPTQEQSKNNDGGQKNAVTQQKVLFFANEKDGYAYILNNSNFDLEVNGVPRQVETYAYITKEGVYVLPTKGTNIEGEDYRNYGNRAEWKVLRYTTSKEGMYIEVRGKWSKVLATVHTHPGIAPGSFEVHSASDEHVMNIQNTMSMVFSMQSNNAYIIIPNSRGRLKIPINSFLNGDIQIRKHRKSMIDFLHNNR